MMHEVIWIEDEWRIRDECWRDTRGRDVQTKEWVKEMMCHGIWSEAWASDWPKFYLLN